MEYWMRENNWKVPLPTGITGTFENTEYCRLSVLNRVQKGS